MRDEHRTDRRGWARGEIARQGSGSAAGQPPWELSHEPTAVGKGASNDPGWAIGSRNVKGINHIKILVRTAKAPGMKIALKMIV
jgi:hypothetical protein